MMHSLLVISVVSHIRNTTVANYSCAYCNFSTSLSHIQSVFQSRNFGLQCLKVSFLAPSLSHSFQFIHYSTTLTFQCLYLLQINKISSSKLLSNPHKDLQSSTTAQIKLRVYTLYMYLLVPALGLGLEITGSTRDHPRLLKESSIKGDHLPPFTTTKGKPPRFLHGLAQQSIATCKLQCFLKGRT